ncbi:MAG: oligosaccharide flippase family protein [Candidatus Stahlbacteria bacterium]|nr:oligosaccharide flippase family protein [Candidatus Stahlbacteria bacterium]
MGQATKNTILTFGAKSLYFVFTFVIGIIIARTTGPEGKGIYSLVILTCSLAAIFAGFGVPTSNACFVGKKSAKLKSSLATNSLLLLIVPIVLFGAAFLILRNTYATNTLRLNLLKYVVIALAVCPFLLLISLFTELLHGMNKIYEFNIVLLAIPFFQVLILLLLLHTADLRLALISWALSNILGAILVSLLLLKTTHFGVIDVPLLKEALKFGFQIWLTNIIGIMSLRFDMYLVAYYLGAKGVGFYSVATAISGFLFYIPTSIAVALLPRFTSTDTKSVSHLTCQGLRVSIASSILLLILLFGAGKFLIPALYGEAFSSAIAPLLILLPGVAIYGMAHITTAYFNAHLGKPIINTGLAGLALVIDIILNIVLTPRLGVVGAAISCTISYILSMVVCLCIFTKLSGSSIKDVLVLRVADIRGLVKWNSQ